MQNSFVRLQPHCPNVMRVITPPYQYYSHYVFGKRKPCTIKLTSGCKECLHDKSKPRWFLGVIDRSTEKYSILDMNMSLFKNLQLLVRDVQYGDPQNYDIEITINDSISNMYSVAAGEQFPVIVDESERELLKFKLLRLTDPVCIELETISTLDQFKNFYLSVRLDFLTVETMTKVVPKWYPEYTETLQKLITFS